MNMSMLYLQYSDDIFMISNGTQNQLQVFLKKSNKQHPTIKFYYQISKEETAFLDTKIYIDDNENIETTVYQKETDCKSFLHSKSEHPLFLKQSIPYSPALRLKCICSTVTEFQNESEKLTEKFIESGYKANDSKEKIDKVNNFDRANLLNHSKISNSKNCIPLIITYNETAPNISKIIQKHWPILQINEKIEKKLKTFQ